MRPMAVVIGFFTALFHRQNNNNFTRKKNMDKCKGNSEEEL